MDKSGYSLIWYFAANLYTTVIECNGDCGKSIVLFLYLSRIFGSDQEYEVSAQNDIKKYFPNKKKTFCALNPFFAKSDYL